MVVIGCGADGGVLTQRLARAGWRAVAMDAGPFWDPDADWVSDEILQPPAVKSAAATAESILTAAGAEEVITIDRYAHLVGGARMGDRPETGVVDRDLRSFAVPNLWITDGSTLPTQGAANPALTIMALVARAADVMVRRAGEGS